MPESPSIISLADGRRLLAHARPEDLQQWISQAQSKGQFYDVSTFAGSVHVEGSVWLNPANVVSIITAELENISLAART